MTKAMTVVAAFGLMAAAPVPSPKPLDPSLAALAAVTSQICRSPAEYGGSVAGSLGMGASNQPAALGPGAVLSRLLSKLIGVNLTGSLKVSSAAWFGVLQKDLAGAQASQRDCASRVFTHMFDAFYLTNTKTAEPVKAPGNPAATFQRIATTVSNDSSTSIEAGPGSNLSVVNGSDNTVITGGSPTIIKNGDQRRNRSHYLAMLQQVYNAGSGILWSVRTTPPTDASIAAAFAAEDRWIRSTYNQLLAEMTPAAANSFIQASASSHMYELPPGLSPESVERYEQMRDVMPVYLANVQYLMEHDTMDPQNAGN